MEQEIELYGNRYRAVAEQGINHRGTGGCKEFKARSHVRHFILAASVACHEGFTSMVEHPHLHLRPLWRKRTQQQKQAYRSVQS